MAEAAEGTLFWGLPNNSKVYWEDLRLRGCLLPLFEAPNCGDRKNLQRVFGEHRHYVKRRGETGKVAPGLSPGRMLTISRAAEQ